MNRLVAWFEHTQVGQAFFARTESDRLVILLVSSLFLVSLLWLLLWKPVADWHTDAVSRFETARSSLDYLRANEALAQRVAAQGGDGSSSLIPLVTRAANAQQLTLNRLQPEGGGTLNVVLENQSFDRVFQWVAQLEQNNGVVTKTVSVRSAEQAGVVNAQIRFAAGGPG